MHQSHGQGRSFQTFLASLKSRIHGHCSSLPASSLATWKSVVAGPALSALPKPVCQSFVIKHGQARVLRCILGANALEDLDS